eukprot:scaffold15016_cov107-Isochrysis_galbana.AAC.1
MIGRAPGGTVKGGGEKGGKASLPGDSRVSRRIRPLALLIFNFFDYIYREREREAIGSPYLTPRAVARNAAPTTRASFAPGGRVGLA